MLQGIVRIGIVVVFIAIIAASSVSGMGLLLDTTQKLTMSTASTDDLFYATVDDNCDYSSITCG
jgi:hypothetical protein